MSGETQHVIVVGGSWAGLAAALQLGRARRRTLLIDAGMPRNRFAHESHGFPGQDGRQPAEILETFRAQVLAYPTVRLVSGVAVAARQEADGRFAVALSSGEQLHAERLVLATGVIDELPQVPGMVERWGVGVLHCPYCHGYEVADRRLAVLGGGETAVRKALLVRDWSGDVTLFTEGAFEPTADEQAALAARGVRIVRDAVRELVGPAPEVSGVRLEDGRVVDVDAVFTTPRTRLASPLAQQLGCARDDGPSGPMVRTDARQETTVPGVYCAGDAARAMHGATFAAADGVLAGMSAHQSLVFAPVARPPEAAAR